MTMDSSKEGGLISVLFDFIFLFSYFPIFSEKRIRSALEKLVKSRQTSAQGRLDGFFTVVGTSSSKRPVIFKKNKEIIYSFIYLYF
jgi:hypothetical protein